MPVSNAEKSNETPKIKVGDTLFVIEVDHRCDIDKPLGKSVASVTKVGSKFVTLGFNNYSRQFHIGESLFLSKDFPCSCVEILKNYATAKLQAGPCRPLLRGVIGYITPLRIMTLRP